MTDFKTNLKIVCIELSFICCKLQTFCQHIHSILCEISGSHSDICKDDVALRSLVDINPYLRQAYCLHHQNYHIIPEDSHICIQDYVQKLLSNGNIQKETLYKTLNFQSITLFDILSFVY